MKALTLSEPWASLAAYGIKQYETRGFNYNHGQEPFLIHAAAAIPKAGRAAMETEPFASALASLGIRGLDDFKLGHILGRVEVIRTARIVTGQPGDGEMTAPTDRELAFGDYTPGRYAWQLVNPALLLHPLPAKGKLSLWEFKVPEAVKFMHVGHEIR